MYDEFLLNTVALHRLENSSKQRIAIECSTVQYSAVHEIVGQEEMERSSAEHIMNRVQCCDRSTHSLKRH